MKKPVPKKKIFLTIILIIFLFYFYQLYSSTGIFQPSKLDSRDSAYWEYKNGSIKGSEPFFMEGNNNTCWLLIHSYSATPAEMKELGERINKNFSDKVYGIKLAGHGELPSKIKDKNLSYWYSQIELEFLKINSSCKNVNVVGSSFGSLLALRLAEENELKNVFITNPFSYKRFEIYKVLPFKWRLNIFSPILNYDKKSQIANINNPEGRKKHIAYWNMPYSSIRNSISLIDSTISNLSLITEPIIIMHSKNDRVANYKGAYKIYHKVSSQRKNIFIFNRSNHVLLLDHDKEEVINKFLSFEYGNR